MKRVNKAMSNSKKVADVEFYDSQIKCTPQCADDCGAHEAGAHETFDEKGARWIVACHDTHAVQDIDGRDYNGAWWQVFDGPEGN